MDPFDASHCAHVGAFAALLAIRNEMEKHYGHQVPIDQFDSHVSAFMETVQPSVEVLVDGLDRQVPKKRDLGWREYTRSQAGDLIRPHSPELAEKISAGKPCRGLADKVLGHRNAQREAEEAFRKAVRKHGP